MTENYWDTFYAKKSLGLRPSTFAQWCTTEGGLLAHDAVLEIGCGNGRDSYFFAQQGLHVVGVDASQVAIRNNQEQADTSTIEAPCVFVHAQLGPGASWEQLTVQRTVKPTAIYCRFVLHAVTQAEAKAILDFCAAFLKPQEKLYLEFRTTRDPMFQRGEKVGEHERMTDHYRRFIEPEPFRHQMAQRGWQELYFLESDGLSPYKDDDPVLARLIYEKTAAQ